MPDEITDSELYDRLFLPATNIKAERPLPKWEDAHTELRKKGMTLQLIWREYREQHNDGLGYSQFCSHYQAFKKTINPIMRQTYKAGEKAFVDYSGMKAEWLDVVS